MFVAFKDKSILKADIAEGTMAKKYPAANIFILKQSAPG